ncbi:MAG: DUF937 domain-containing protein, partial [Alphaproteobacteria bacterium]|nr:DUF937 domain-containing protein [Alphaproteobacteria bacterium]
ERVMNLSAIGQQYGLDPAQTEAAVAALAPVIAAGMRRNASSDAGLGSIMEALQQGQQSGQMGSTSDAGNVVLSQIFGLKDVSRGVADQLSASSGISSSILKKLLPVIAAYIMSQMMSGQAGGAARGSGGGLGDILGSILGGGQGGAAPRNAPTQQAGPGGGLGDILGNVVLQGGGRQHSWKHPRRQQSGPGRRRSRRHSGPGPRGRWWPED